MSKKVKVVVTLSEEVVELMDVLAKIQIRNRTSLIEHLIRQEARGEELEWSKGLGLVKHDQE